MESCYLSSLRFLNSLIILKIAKGLFIFAALFFVAPKLLANDHDYGCRYGNRIFKIYDTAHPLPTNFQYDSDGNGSPNGYSPVDERCDNGETTVCTLYDYDEVTIKGYGILADFSIDYCPLDDYVLTLFIFTISVGFLKLLKPD